MGIKGANSRQRQTRTKEREESRSFETLIRKLVACATHGGAAPAVPPPPGNDGVSAGEILFTCEVDGVRCVLARAHQASGDDRSLSPREQEIARMIAKGHPNKIIASVLEISVWTVSTHLRRIYAKLGVTSRAALVTWMFEHRKL